MSGDSESTLTLHTMNLLTPILIWLAKRLIEHFLSSHAELSRQLDAAVLREQELRESLADHTRKQESYQEAIDEKAAKVGQLSNLLHDVENTLKEMESRYDERKKVLHDAIDSMSDADVVRAAI